MAITGGLHIYGKALGHLHCALLLLRLLLAHQAFDSDDLNRQRKGERKHGGSAMAKWQGQMAEADLQLGVVKMGGKLDAL